ncbi:uncharacterized protein [Pempheris klunzingeri]|uniref:uncharacterized protein n=1 Tax=Pempheris klunzingeri TaxID=3127111 RepID=UPI003980484E
MTQLTKSDSGRYRCALERPLFTDPFRTFEVIVTDAPTTSKPNTTVPSFPTSSPSASTQTTTQSLSSNPRGSTPSTTNDEWLYVGLTLAIMIVLLSLAVLIYCRRRASEPKGPPVDTEYASVTESNRAYEDIREYRQNRSLPVGISSVYPTAKYTKPNAAESNDNHSFGTTAGSRNTAEDNGSKLTYAEVKFYDRAAGSSHSAPSGDANDVVYAVPRVAVRHVEDDVPVYSTVT